jgi:hypothetical protein
VFKWVFVLSLLGGLGVTAYQSGSALSERALNQAREEIGRLRESVAALERDNAALRTAAEVARMREAETKQLYEKDVPAGQRKALLSLVDEQLGQGAKADRLRFLISAASVKEKCDGEPVTKRFIVRTPLYDGPASAVQFADDALTVTAEGTPASDAQGRVLAWYDPAKPITLEIARLGRPPDRLSGELPIHHAVVVNGSEYRLSVVPGERRGFVQVTSDRCRFP